MVEYQENIAKNGHTLKSLVDGITLFETLADAADTAQLKKLCKDYLEGLRQKLDSYNKVWK